jgi:uncharacterized membrane protein
LARQAARLLLAVFFIGAGIGHFTTTDFFVSIVPPYLPAPLALVYVSGVCEITGGLGVLLPATRRAAGIGLVALLIAVFPANLNMAIHPGAFVAQGIPFWSLYARLPLQLAFMAWAWWATR